MLSRRNVRIKVMQVLYAVQKQEDQSYRARKAMYDKLVDRSFQLYLQNLLIIQRVAAYAKQDQARRMNKHLRSEQDKTFTPKLAHNPVMSSLINNPDLTLAYDRKQIGKTIDADLIGKLYRDFLKTEVYQEYLANPDTTIQEDRKVTLALFKWLQGQERFLTMVEDHFPLWGENKSLIIGAIKKTIKALPAEQDFFNAYQQPSATVTEFGNGLLKFTTDADAQLLEKIKPVLENWDVERVALIDMILIKMALAEFLHFESIPATVSLNEYVEISKLYSTDKSREFINGVLDKLLKQLQEEGLIPKA
ncbi:hypothetical protein CEQ90_00845 [Lewinellaceae bacterium SD302]|nr:hypothetical protein CEQ90_00845 [Lewinellaceae bacterium SD302]